MIEIRKPWKQEGLGGAKEGPLTSVWETMNIDQLRDLGLEAQKQAAGFAKELLQSLQEDEALEAKLAEIHASAAKTEERLRAAQVHMDFVETLASKTLEEFKRLEPRTTPKIEIPPGHRLFSFLTDFAPKKFREHVLEPQRADAMHEYFDACEAGDERKVSRLKYMINVWLIWSVFSGAISAMIGLLKVSSTGVSKD